ncbi:MAG: protein translocase subunit SecD [Leptospiraceae bacterium]|nr:protein translocase subunit SecD [Leptospiraceae bacterium]
MPDTKNLINRSLTALAIILGSLILFWPNIAGQELIIAFRDTVRQADGSKKSIDPAVVADFIRDAENGLRYYFPNGECQPAAGEGFDATHRCILKGRFLTTARINNLTQAFPELVNDTYTHLAPHPIEKALGFLQAKKDSKNLKVKLGLDLQGGMRAVFQADFDGYLERQKEKTEPYIQSREGDLLKESDPAKKQEIEKELKDLRESLVLDEVKKRSLLARARTVLAKRLASQGLTEPELRVQEASYSISVDMPGVANSTEVLNRLGDTVHVEYRIVNDELTNKVLSDQQNIADLRQIRDLYRRQRFEQEDIDELMEHIRDRSRLKREDGRLFVEWSAAKEGGQVLPSTLMVLGPPALDGEDMRDAGVSLSQNSAYYQVNFLTNSRGERLLGDLTARNLKKRMAILWGDRVVSAPTIQSRISSQGQITGAFTQTQANEIASVIRDGALPVELQVLSVNFIGPSLGQKSIVTGMISILLGFVVVIIFMVAYYRLTGLVAVIALFLNLLIMAATMSLFEFTLTLPGFAGVILTVGMAVDASVIIFEKIKEDLSAGKSASVAIESGFASSLWTIMDANLTTLIAAIVLWMSKDGPIMGFALVLFFGLISSMLTALFISRIVFDWSLYILRYQKMSIGWGQQVENANPKEALQ